MLYFNKGMGNLLCISVSPLRAQLMKEAHDADTAAGHLGRVKTYEKLSRTFFWPNMQRTVNTYVSTCDSYQCNKFKTRPPYGLLHPHAVPHHKWEVVSMDFVTGLLVTKAGHDCIFNVVDKLTR